ncbi:MAG TPA: hemolysin family protein [Anaerolineales bacterium]
MDDPDLFYWISLIILLIFDLLLVATRASLLIATLARLLGQREQMMPQVNRTLAVLSSPARLKASLLITQSMVRFLLAGLAVLVFVPLERLASPVPYAVGVLLLTAIGFFFLEWLVEWRVVRQPETWAIRLSILARVLMFVLTPLLALPLVISRQANPSPESQNSVTETELMTLVEAGQEEGLLEQGERRMIVSIFKLGDTLAREIMVPRIDLLALDVDTPLTQAVDALLESGFSRVPVFQETVDNILGLLYTKDLLRILREGNQIDSLKDLLRRAYFVPEAKKVDELLAEMQAHRIHMAIVVDEYGGVAGLVTLEDIVEEIVGEIHDEYDQAEETLYQQVNESEYIFQGRVDLDDFNEIMESNIPRQEADTLAGFIYSRIGRVPVGGENVQVDNLELTVEQVSGRRIRKVRAQRISTASQNGETENHVDG